MPLRNLSPNIAKTLFENNWPIRRRWLRIGVLMLTLNAEMVLYYIIFSEPNPLLGQIFMTLIGAILSIFFAFVFGAVWDDNNKRGHLAGMNTQNDDEQRDDEQYDDQPKELPEFLRTPRADPPASPQTPDPISTSEPALDPADIPIGRTRRFAVPAK